MKALVFKRYGKADSTAFADLPRPVPGPDEILVEVHAAGLNPIDTMIPKGTFKPFLKFQLPATLGSDLAGVVVEVGGFPNQGPVTCNSTNSLSGLLPVIVAVTVVVPA